MTKKDRSDRLIINFMDLSETEAPEYVRIEFGGSPVYFINGEYQPLKYQESYDWLYHVIDKIEEMGLRHEVSKNHIDGLYYSVFHGGKSIISARNKKRIAAIYDSVIQIIENIEYP